MYKVIVIDDEMLVRRGIVMETDWQTLNCVVVAEAGNGIEGLEAVRKYCLLYTSPSPRDRQKSRMPSSA